METDWARSAVLIASASCRGRRLPWSSNDARSCLALLSGQAADVAAHEADVQERDDHHQDEGDDRHRRAETDEAVLAELLVGLERHGVRPVRALCQDER